ncbi:cytochrome P450 [Amycolatopsis thermoflava]|uniref:cytochrome P450 n=1 Tax=Amycolatopsis thermoflava TaxID=84480 RepID=UPI00380A3148
MNGRIDDLIVAPSTYADPELTRTVFTRLRQEEPVRWTEPDGYRPFWTISKAADIREIERLREVFINEPRYVIQSEETERASREFSGGRSRPFRTLPSMDGETHLSHRAVAQQWFTRGNVLKLTDEVRKVAGEFVQRLLETGGRTDFCKTVGLAFPLRVIMSVFGVPAEDEDELLRYSKLFATPSDPETGHGRNPAEVTMEGAKGFARYFKALVAERRANPKDDLASVIANGRIGDDLISEEAAVAYCVVVSTAGFDTTSFSTAGGVLALIENPDQMAALRANPELMSTAVDEIIRWVTPVKSFMRTATQDHQLRDKTIRAGEAVLLSFASANRDEEVYADPFRFDVSRKPNPHLAFGFGAHSCLGMHLAKLEISSILEQILAATSEIELAGEPEYYHANVVQGLKRLPISFQAA